MEQVDRIADLEKQVEHYKNKAEYLDKRELELLSEITSLEKDLHMIQRHYDQLEMFSPSGNNAQDVGNTNINLPNGKSMNAYELAQKLNDAVNKNEKHLTLDIEVMLMLRQQADRIAELEKVIQEAVKAFDDASDGAGVNFHLYAEEWKTKLSNTAPQTNNKNRSWSDICDEATAVWDSLDTSNQSNIECARAWFLEGYHQALTKGQE